LNHSHDRVVRCEVIEQNSPALGEPTHGVFVDGIFHFIGRSGWEYFDKGKFEDRTNTKPPVILRIQSRR